MKIKLFMALITALFAFYQGVWAWEGLGTESNPYLIESVADLNQLSSDVNNGESYIGKHFLLKENLTNVGTFTPIGSFATPFDGIFDGGGKTISGIVIDKDSEYSGLFGYMGYSDTNTHATVKNVTLSSCTINGANNTGGIVGDNKYGTVENFYVASCTISGDRYTGGIVGQNEHGTVKNCHVAANVVITITDKELDLGGIVGLNYGMVSGCTCAADFNVTGDHNIGGIVGWNYNNSVLENCLYLGASFKSAALQYSGTIAGRNNGTASNSYYINQSYKGIGVEQNNMGTDIEGAQLAVEFSTLPDDIGTEGITYDNGITVYENGLKYKNKYYTPYVADGSENHPYIIASPSDLDQLATNVNTGSNDYADKYVILVNDLVYGNGTGTGENNYTPIGCDNNHSFKGIFNGQGHTISGVVIERQEFYNGIFGHITMNAVVKNLTLKASTIMAERYCGGIVGYASAFSTDANVEITNCHVSNDVRITALNGYNQDSGGIIGYIGTRTTVAGCTCAATIANSYPTGQAIGGIAGNSGFGTIKDCLFFGEVNAVQYCGAIAGYYIGSNCILTRNFYTNPSQRGVGTANSIAGEDVEGALLAQEYDELSLVPEGIGELLYLYSDDNDNNYISVRENGLYYSLTNKYYYPGPAELKFSNDQANTEIISQYVGRTANVQLQDRTIYMDGSWNTLILPFYVDRNMVGSTLENTEFIQITTANFSNGTLTLTFNPVGTVVGGQPFLVRRVKTYDTTIHVNDLVNPVFKNVVIGKWKSNHDDIGSGSYVFPSLTPYYAAPNYNNNNPDAEDNLISMKGSFDPVTLESGDRTKLYLGAGNTLYYPNADVTLGAFRCYFELIGLEVADATNGINSFNLNFNDETTGIVNIGHSTSSIDRSADAWYTLDGRQLQGMPTQKGIYIFGGKKVVIK